MNIKTIWVTAIILAIFLTWWNTMSSRKSLERIEERLDSIEVDIFFIQQQIKK